MHGPLNVKYINKVAKLLKGNAGTP